MEPLFLLATVPGEIASAVASAGVLAIVALWRRNIVLEDRNQANIREMLAADHAVADALKSNIELTRAIYEAILNKRVT